MILSCSERLQMPTLLPSTGDILTLSQSLEMLEATKLSKADRDKLAIKTDENGNNVYYSFPTDKDFDSDITISATQLVFLKKYASDMNNQGKVTVANLSLIKKILAA